MSLRSFHILFIAVVIVFMAFFTLWFGRLIMHGHEEFILLGFAAGAGLVAGIPYLAWFIGKGSANARS